MTNLEKKSCDVIFLDTETTGLDPETDEILQIVERTGTRIAC